MKSKVLNEKVKLSEVTTQLPSEIDENSLRESYEVFGRENLIRLFKKQSIIAQLLMEDPGTFKMLEIVYTGKVLDDVIDRYLLNSLPAQALRNRLAAVIFYLDWQIRKMIENNERGLIKIVNLGSGSARDIITLMAKNTGAFDSVFVDCVDIDSEALTTAKRLAQEAKVSSNLNFIQRDLISCPYRGELDLGVLVGILCGLDYRKCVILLKKIKRYFKKGGVLIASNVATHMLKQEPFFSQIVLGDIIGWKLVYKTTEELRRIFEEAGYEWIDVFYDEPTRFHAMGVGRVPLV